MAEEEEEEVEEKDERYTLGEDENSVSWIKAESGKNSSVMELTPIL